MRITSITTRPWHAAVDVNSNVISFIAHIFLLTYLGSFFSSGLGGRNQRSVLGSIRGKFRAWRAKAATVGDVMGEGRIAEASPVKLDRPRGRSWTNAPLPQRACDGGAWLCSSAEATSFPDMSRTRALQPMCFDEQ